MTDFYYNILIQHNGMDHKKLHLCAQRVTIRHFDNGMDHKKLHLCAQRVTIRHFDSK